MMLEEPTNLSPWERDKLRLDFAAWLAKRARRFHCETAQIVAVVIPDAASAAASPLAAGSPVGELRASPSPGDEANSDHGPSDAATETTHSAAPPTADNGGSNPAPMAEVVLHAASADHSPERENEPGDGSQPSPSVGSSDRANVSIGVTSGERPTQNSPETAIAEVSVPTTPDTSVTSSADQSSGDGEGQPVPAPSVRPATTGKSGSAPNEASPAPTLKQLVRPVWLEHPDWSAGEIAAHVGRPKASVAATISVLRKEPRHVIVVPQEPAPAPEPAPEPERPPATAQTPARPMPPGTGSAVVVTPMRRPPRGVLFWLRNDAGEYLNRYCGGMTKDRREAWVGTEAQLAACRRNFVAAHDLTERPVEKEQSRVGA